MRKRVSDSLLRRDARISTKSEHRTLIKKRAKQNWQLYVMILFPILWLVIFHYVPMYGAQIAFRRYRAVDGIWGSEWVGWHYFRKFVDSYNFTELLENTVYLSFYQLIAGFPFAVTLALLLNNTLRLRYKKVVQIATYMPHFISTVVMVGILIQFTSPQVGVVNEIIEFFGGTPINFMGKPELFRHLYVWSGIWQSTGWNAIIYLSVLSAVDPELHEAAMIDGASRWQRMINIELPTLIPTMTIILIINAGQIMNVGFEKAYLMQNDLNLQRSEIIATFTYKIGLASAAADFSYSSAIGLFNSVANFLLIIAVNFIARRYGETSLW